ncbi:Aminotransferase-like [Abeliophyllum distichum]|uniref:Aminotransferase-like n=1 Tax=Abeliophyllum distichum TaxID=126358 RepID=A0ABD1V4W6_9LAMI
MAMDLLELTLDIPAFDPTLFSVALCVWASDYNTFIFPLGPMSITLMDISALINLPLIGTTISPAMVVTHVPPSTEKQFFGSYKQLQTLRGNITAEPNHVECVAFIHYCRTSITSPIASQQPIILDSPMVSITEEPQILETPARMAEKTQSPHVEGSAVVTYILQSQYARSIILESEGSAFFAKEMILPSLSEEMPSSPKAADEDADSILRPFKLNLHLGSKSKRVLFCTILLQLVLQPLPFLLQKT